MSSVQLLLPESLAPLVRNTIFSGNIHYFDRVESTNALALEAAAHSRHHADSVPEGAVFLAEGRKRPGADAAATPGFPKKVRGFIVRF